MTPSYNYDDDEWFPEPLPANVAIGERSYLYSTYAFRHYRSNRPCGVRIGNDTGVYDGTFFNLGPEGEVTIGDYGCVVAPVFSIDGRVSIGDYCWISWDVVIADTPWAVPPGSREALAGGNTGGEIVLEDNVWIGTRVVLLAGAHIGEGSIVGAGAVVDFEVPPCSIAAGNPGRVMGPIGSRA